MKFSRLYAIFLRQFYLLRSSPTRACQLFIWVMIDMLLWGFIARYLGHLGAGFSLATALLGGVLLWDFMIRVMHGASGAFLEDVWSRNFLNIFASPLTIWEYIGGLTLTTILTSMIGLAIMLALAVPIFDLSFAGYGVLLFPFLLTLFFFGIALGIVAVAMVLRLGPSAEWFVWPIPAFISPFACVFYPMSTLPNWMQWVAYTVPPSYVFENMRGLLAGQPVETTSWIGPILLSLLYVLLACIYFARTYRFAVRSGLIARYSAETVN